MQQPYVLQQPMIVGSVGTWTNGICDCCEDCGFCVIAYFLPCVAYGQNKELMGEGCVGGCLLYTLLAMCGLNLCVACSTRGQIRSRYGIHGDCCSDCCSHVCCHPCSLAQEHLQLCKVPYQLPTTVIVGGQPNVMVYSH